MPTTPAQLPIAELDYDQILSNLIAFMKDDPTFSDYDFTGSGLRLLSRVLAYVTFYNNYYVTAAVNESFLDTAQLRSSIVSHAKMLGYNAHGTQSAEITTNVTAVMTSSSATSVTMPKNTKFELANDTSYLFYTTDDTTLLQNTTTANNYEASDVLLVEGRPATYQFTVDVNDPTQRFIIPNANASFSHIGVVVQESATANTRTTFVEPTNVALVNDANAIFLVSEAYNGYPELTFGNGVVGKKLVHGNIVLVDYYISRGTGGNGIYGPFISSDPSFPGLARGVTPTNTIASYNGADAEDVDQIRYIAPLMYSAQNRCVTGEDYKALILAEYGDSIAAINVFGGEEGNPNDVNERPAYGHVYIALKPKVGLRFTDSTHNIIMKTVVAPRQVIGVLPEIVIPDYVYVVVKTKALYDTKATTRSKDALVSAIKTGISEYATSAVEKFDTAFRFSRLARAIDDTDPAISSSLTRVEIQKRIQPTLNVRISLTLKFGGPLLRTGNTSVILPATQLTGHRFGYTAANNMAFSNCFFAEANDVLQVVAYANSATSAAQTLVVVQDSIGTVNTTSGVVTIAAFRPTDIEGDKLDIRLNALPLRSDLVPSLNRLFTVDPTSIQVDVASDAVTTAATDFYSGGVLR
ncbi:MAG: hypothetical protein VX262_07795 [Acidobacteriota bacterium]|nr:hypothetical protein [Acidobacteriota bacterium]